MSNIKNHYYNHSTFLDISDEVRIANEMSILRPAGVGMRENRVCCDCGAQAISNSRHKEPHSSWCSSLSLASPKEAPNYSPFLEIGKDYSIREFPNIKGRVSAFITIGLNNTTTYGVEILTRKDELWMAGGVYLSTGEFVQFDANPTPYFPFRNKDWDLMEELP